MLQPQALKYFAEVARTGSLRQASDAYFVAPSAISRQISNLEKDLGADLFERSSRGMLLTEAGHVMLRFVHESSTNIDHLRAEIDDLSNLRQGTISLAVAEGTVSSFLPDLMASFTKAHPGIRFRVSVLGTHQLAEQVACEAAEIGLAFNSPDRDDLTLQGRIAQPMQVVFRPGHPLQQYPRISMAQLDGMPVALPDRTFGIRRLIERAAHTAGTTLDIVHESNSLQLLKALVTSSDVITFMPLITFELEACNGVIAYAPLDDARSAQASVDIISAHGRKLSAASRAFLSHLVQHCRASACAAQVIREQAKPIAVKA